MHKHIKSNLSKILKQLSTLLLLSSLTFTAWAISLEDAKQQGLVGEMPNGYLGVVVKSAATKQLVDNVNKKRRSIYLDLARKNKITMAQVTALAGQKAIAKTRPGHLIQNAAGQWVKK
ncbi:hypothetical protein SAMN05216262_11934 [Colwellia chukchiensis]|uniref:DUF1318 domain-containing protein n=1 Tax=Colwellia chukchiensis TaxID=641665 RepID=A0A1H7SK13_9GAMM|nr:YdbL family protein [Colwellia chukchiensis]SEL72853.1 hypothetical protein SAMN05216262_11934 [Colwellia chukchiensis]